MIECESTAGLSKTDKTAIRQRMRVRRQALSAAERAHAASVICGKPSSEVKLALDSCRGRESVCAVYHASPDEIDLSAGIEDMLARGVAVVAPRWNGKTYELARLKGLEEENLRKGPMGILEPKDADLVHPKDVSVWLVPRLAFTRSGGRLGYGGGWYDRLMADADRSALKLGIAYAFQLVGDLLAEPHDIRLDVVVDDSPAA